MYLDKVNEAQSFLEQGFEFLKNSGRIKDAENLKNKIYEYTNQEFKL